MAAPVTPLSIAPGIGEARGPFPLLSAKIMSPVLIERAHRVAECWSQVAKERREKASLEYVEDSTLIGRLSDLKSVSDSIVKQISEGSLGRSMTLYAIVDRARKLQGLALAIFYMDKKSKISFLAANPDNIPTPWLEGLQVRGAGTALVRHIAHDLVASQSIEKTLSLLPTISAELFYSRLGFSAPSIYNPNMEITGGLLDVLAHPDMSGRHVMLPDDRMLEILDCG